MLTQRLRDLAALESEIVQQNHDALVAAEMMEASHDAEAVAALEAGELASHESTLAATARRRRVGNARILAEEEAVRARQEAEERILGAEEAKLHQLGMLKRDAERHAEGDKGGDEGVCPLMWPTALVKLATEDFQRCADDVFMWVAMVQTVAYTFRTSDTHEI